MDLARNIYITGIHKIARLDDWKNYIIPFLSGVIFISVLIYAIPFNLAVRITGLLLVSIIGTAAFGYLLNNIFDLEEDMSAGRSNFTENISGLAKTVYVLIFLTMALAPWLLLPVAPLTFGLFILQLVLLYAYSVPPLRLKQLVHAGVIIDALYNSVIMVFALVFTIREYAEISLKNGNLILIVLFIVLFVKGLRGILLHQLADRKNDRKAGVKTFVSCYGPLLTNNIVSKLLLPLEFSTLTILIVLLSGIIPGLTWLYLGFIIYIALKYRLWNFRWIPTMNYFFFFRFTLNDFFEQWIPLFILVLLSIKDISFLLMLIPFILLFPSVLCKLYVDIPEGIVSFIGDFRRIFQI